MSTQTYQLDATHSAARFSVRHMMISRVHGEFTTLSGTLQFDPASPASASVNVEIDAASVTTHQTDRDTHLKSADFFDVAQFPTLTFASTSVSISGEEEGSLSGDLTIHGVTKPVTLQVEGAPVEIKDPWGNLRLGFTARTKIKRSDYGLTYNAALEAGGVLIGDDIEITLDVQFVRPGA